MINDDSQFYHGSKEDPTIDCPYKDCREWFLKPRWNFCPKCGRTLRDKNGNYIIKEKNDTS